MAKAKQPDIRKARKKKNIGKMPTVPEAQNTGGNKENPSEQNSNI